MEKMRHQDEEVLNVLVSLQSFSSDDNFQNNLQIIQEYIEDILKLMERYKKLSEMSVRSLSNLTTKIETLKQTVKEN